MKNSAFSFYKALGLIAAALISIFGAALGWIENIPTQTIVFYATSTFAIVLWGWHHFSINWVYKSDTAVAEKADEMPAHENKILFQGLQQDQSYLRRLITNNRRVVIVIIGGFIALAVAASVVDGFFAVRNLISVAVFIAFVIGAFVLNKFIAVNKSAFFGITVLIGLFIIGSLVVDGFLSSANIKSMLVFASFLGLASIGQTLVALLAGLDLSIPFVIGSSNIGLMWLFTLGVPPWIAVIIILLLGALIGFINGILSFRLQGQALIMTLGVGFAVTGGAQIITSIGSAFGGTVFGVVPRWLSNIAAMNGTTFGLEVPPVILIWIAISVILVVGLRNTSYGRNLYALGGSRTAAERLSISERRYWIGVYTLSGTISAFTGALLLGWSGGGFVGVGDQYLFMTLAAVVVGGTSLLGGQGGYGFTVIGVLVLQVLTSFLVGIGLDFEGQQFVFGLLILPMVALYARSPHISTQI